MTLARMVLLFLIVAVGTTAVRGADDGINDGVDRTDPKFVTASLMIFYPHQLTDWAYVIIVVAYIVFYAKQGSRQG